MTSKDIQKEYTEKYVAFSKKQFNLVKLPDDIKDRFEEALFYTAPNQHLLLANDIRVILAKTPDQFSNLEVGHVVNAIMSAPVYLMYKDMDEYLVKGSFYSALKVQYNKMMEDQEEVLKIEANAKMRIIRH